MTRFRLFLAWLVLAALPLQGFAAAGMLLCGPAQRVAAQLAAPDHGHGDDHGSHAVHDPGAHGAHGHGGASPDDPEAAGAQLAADSHSCSACAASCHAVALTGEPAPVALAPAPHVPLSEPFERYDSRPPPVPDKPPRA